MLQEPPHILHIIKLKCLHASFMTATLRLDKLNDQDAEKINNTQVSLKMLYLTTENTVTIWSS